MLLPQHWNKQTKKSGQGLGRRRERPWKDTTQPATSICIHVTALLHWLPTWHPCRCTDSRVTMQHRTHICCQEAWNPCLVSCPMFARCRINEAESWHQRVATIRISEHHFHSAELELSLCSVFASFKVFLIMNVWTTFFFKPTTLRPSREKWKIKRFCCIYVLRVDTV